MSHKNDHQIPLETTWKPRRFAGLYITSGKKFPVGKISWHTLKVMAPKLNSSPRP